MQHFFQNGSYTAKHVINTFFIIAVSKFISVEESQLLVIVKHLSYFDVRNMFQGKNANAKGNSDRSFRRFCTSNNMKNKSNFSKEELQKIIFLQTSKLRHLKYLLFMEIIVF